MLAEVEATALWLLLGLPLPLELLPGYDKYVGNLEQLDKMVYKVIDDRRRAGAAAGRRWCT